MIYDRHPELQSKWDKAFWARGYYVETIGNITDEAVQKYIKEQAEESRKEDSRGTALQRTSKSACDIRPLGRAVTIALRRANNKPPVELVVVTSVYTGRSADDLRERLNLSKNAELIIYKYKAEKEEDVKNIFIQSCIRHRDSRKEDIELVKRRIYVVSFEHNNTYFLGLEKKEQWIQKDWENYDQFSQLYSIRNELLQQNPNLL